MNEFTLFYSRITIVSEKGCHVASFKNRLLLSPITKRKQQPFYKSSSYFPLFFGNRQAVSPTFC